MCHLRVLPYYELDGRDLTWLPHLHDGGGVFLRARPDGPGPEGRFRSPPACRALVRACLLYAGPGAAADRTTAAGRGARGGRTALPARGAELGPGTRGWQAAVRAATATPRGRDRSEW